MTYKMPISVLVVIHTRALEVLLLERAGHPGFWQSVTGSLEAPDEPLQAAAAREVFEETGIEVPPERPTPWHVCNTYEIFPVWRHRYAPGVTHNLEHVFGLQLPERAPVRIAPAEHTACGWFPWQEAAEKCFSWSNRDAIRMLPRRAGIEQTSGGRRPR